MLASIGNYIVNPTHMLVFIDESGDPRLKGREGSRKLFQETNKP